MVVVSSWLLVQSEHTYLVQHPAFTYVLSPYLPCGYKNYTNILEASFDILHCVIL